MDIILASTSPRRIELLQQVGISVEVMRPDADETPLPREMPRALVSRLAREKARSVASRSAGPALVIAADTIVLAPNGKTILGKPENVADAERMLKLLSGKRHTVLTGYCIYPVAEASGGRPARPHVRVVVSRVSMRKLTPKQIKAYVATGEPMDKAGSYAAQGIGMGLIEKLSGSYTNVVGLPMCQLLSDLETRFGVALFDDDGN